MVWVEIWLNNDDNDEYCLIMVGIYYVIIFDIGWWLLMNGHVGSLWFILDSYGCKLLVVKHGNRKSPNYINGGLLRHV